MDQTLFDRLYAQMVALEMARRWASPPAPVVDLASDDPDPCEGIFPDVCPRETDDRPLAKVLPFRGRAHA